MTDMAKLIRVLGVMMVGVFAIPAAGLAQVTPPTPPATPVVPVPPRPPSAVVLPTVPIAPLVLDLQRLQELQWPALALELDARRLADQMRLLNPDEIRWDALDQARAALDRTRVFEGQETKRAFEMAFASSDGYTQGKDMLNQRRYDDAIVRFDRVVAQKAAHVDGALYWKAYAQYKLGKTDDSVATIAQLRRDHPQSRYLSDAKVLEADAKRRAGQPVNPADMDDDELKLLAIMGIQRTDPERVIPLVEVVLGATNSLKVKKQALYVLALSTQPKAHQILLSYAKGAGNPDLQQEAIRHRRESRQADHERRADADLPVHAGHGRPDGGHQRAARLARRDRALHHRHVRHHSPGDPIVGAQRTLDSHRPGRAVDPL
jgi:hypothetical protein